jgi:hypothetical protein
MMRFSGMIVIVLAAMSVSGVEAQQTNTFKVKPSHTAKAPKPKMNAPIGKAAGNPAAASTTTSRDLQSVERQTAKTSAPSRTTLKKAPGSSTAYKPVKDKPTPPINFNGTSGKKSTGMTSQAANPYKGRLRQKHTTNK